MLLTQQRERVPVSTKVLFLEEIKLPDIPWISRGHDGAWIHQFNYEAIPLWLIPVEDWLRPGLEGLLPFTPFTKGAKVEVLDEVYAALEQVPDPLDRANSFLYTLVFARRRFDAVAVNNFIRRHKVLQQVVEESPLYQEIIQLGEERGQKLGEELGEKHGKLEGLREAILELWQVNAPTTVGAARDHLATIDDLGQLRALLLRVSQAKNAEELDAIWPA